MMFEQNGPGKTSSNVNLLFSRATSGSREARLQQVVQVIDSYIEKLKACRMDRFCISKRLKLMQMRERAIGGENLAVIEKDLWAMAADIENPSLRIQRNVMIVTALYTLIAVSSFSLLAITEAILIPNFNIPYSILMMGLLGSLSSMYIILPNFQSRKTVSDTTTLIFIIKPPIAVIMAGLFFGLIQLLLPLAQKLLPFVPINLSDESWFYWVMAWCVGFINWANLNFKFKFRMKRNADKDSRFVVKNEIIKNPKEPDGLQIDDIIDYVQSTYNGTVIDYNWGDRGIFYNPDNRLPRGIHIMTFKVKDSRKDKVSGLNRKGIYRLNMGISKESFNRIFGSTPPRPKVGGTANTEYDYQQLDRIMPHPKFGWMAWLSVLNPGQATFETLKPLVEESYKLARKKYGNKVNTDRWPSRQRSLDNVAV